VNPEQASKVQLWDAILPMLSGWPLRERVTENHLFRSAGVVGAACREGLFAQRERSVLGGRSRLPTLGEPAAETEVGEAHGTEEASNDGGGTGPHFWASMKERRIGGLA
jgi:hypothetical protein